MKKTWDCARTGFDPCRALRAFWEPRCKGGAYRNQLDRAFCELLREPSDIHLKRFAIRLGVLLFGGGLVNAVLADRAVLRTGICGADGIALADALYHYAPAECVEQILSSGLVPKKHYVFLTENPELLGQTYLPWKTSEIGKETTYALLAVDAGLLSKQQSIFCTDREHEFVTGKINARYISVVSDGRCSTK